MIRELLHAFGCAAAHVLFFRAETPDAVVDRLRIAYRLVGVKIAETPVVDGRRRTIFLCPYRNLAAGRYGTKWLCHDVLDRVDDGYVAFLQRHRDIDYRRPTSCSELDYCGDTEYCFSEVSRR